MGRFRPPLDELVRMVENPARSSAVSFDLIELYYALSRATRYRVRLKDSIRTEAERKVAIRVVITPETFKVI